MEKEASAGPPVVRYFPRSSEFGADRLLHINDHDGSVGLAEAEGLVAFYGDFPVLLTIERRRWAAILMDEDLVRFLWAALCLCGGRKMHRAGEVDEARGILDPERGGVAVFRRDFDVCSLYHVEDGIVVLARARL